jgi:hypothetical protein
MATVRNAGLLELVSRGKKDVFFTSNPKNSFFHGVYMKSAPFTKEIHVTQPNNVPDWGKYIDFEIEQRGDIVKEFKLRITLPTWLPPAAASVNPKGLITFMDGPGSSVGYTNLIGFNCIEKIQLFNDSLLINEVYGEFLAWRYGQIASDVQTLALAKSIGYYEETPLNIGRTATLPTLYVPIPILGHQLPGEPGLPLIAMKKTRLRLRVYLKKFEDLIVRYNSAGFVKYTSIFEQPINVTRNPTILSEVMTTLKKEEMAKPLVALEASYLFVKPDVQVWLKSQRWHIPFYQVQKQEFPIEDNVMNSAYLSAAPVNIPLKLDFIGPAQRIFFAFQAEGSRLSNDLNNYVSFDNLSFIQSARINIANIDRVIANEPTVYQEVSDYWKNIRSTHSSYPSNKTKFHTVAFGNLEDFQPSGTLHMTRAVQPLLYLTLNRIGYDYRSNNRKTYCIVYAETVNIFEIENGIGRVLIDE